MDETTLNDLLECSVCLERLDTTSKVLPCQHTFCRACLEVIVASHNELRCPECRVLVDIKIDELPPNVLLMRILEGLKNAAAASSNIKTTNEQTEKVEQLPQQLQQRPQFQQNKQQQQQQLQQQSTTQRRCLLPHAYALYDFDSSEPTDLHFKKGDLILLKHKIDANWFVGQLNGVEGTFPSNYVQVMVSLPTPQAIALYDFKMQPNEEEGCLNFKKGAVVHVLRRVDQNWAEGRIGNAIGIFPIAFVELNALAKKLIQRMEAKTTIMPPPNLNQQQQCNATARNLPPIPLLDPTTNTSDTTTSPSSESPSTHSNATTSPSASENHNAALPTTSSSSNLSSNSNSLPNTPQHYVHGASGGSVRYRNGREKRHSLNALLLNGAASVTPGLSILQTNRHSAEILSIPSEELIIGSDEHQAAAAMPQSSVAREQRQSANSNMQQMTTTRANVLKTACGPTNIPATLPWGYLALYPYKPRKSDELELKKGCVYIVTERCLDGWFKGKNWQDISGVFPGNYVTPLRARDQQQLMHQWKFVPQQTTSPPQSSSNNGATSTATANITNLHQHKNSNLHSLQDQTKVFPKPPELPPRHAATTTTCASVWTKPLSHTVEAFFNRSSSNAKNDDKSKDKDVKTKESSSSGAVSLMKRLTHIKSRAKSPGCNARNTASSPTTTVAAATSTVMESTQTQISSRPTESTLQATASLQPVHIRSGSCPSQLLQNLQNTTNAANQSTQKPQQPINLNNHGSERIKGHKERPRIQAARQSIDSTLRSGIYANMNTAPTTASMITNNFQLNPKCGQQFQMQQQQFFSTPHNANHRKSHSLDANNMLGGVAANVSSMAAPLPPPPQPNLLPAAPQLSMPNCNVTAAAVAQSATTKSTHCGRESRFRCIVPYPPNSDVELELHVGDIIYVQRKQKNGWYKGTHSRTQKTGLFPASFVEPDF